MDSLFTLIKNIGVAMREDLTGIESVLKSFQENAIKVSLEGVEKITIQGKEGPPGPAGKDAPPVDENDLIKRVLQKVPTPFDGKDADEEAIYQRLLKKIPKPIPGKDAPPVDINDVARRASALIKIPEPKTETSQVLVERINNTSDSVEWRVLKNIPKYLTEDYIKGLAGVPHYGKAVKSFLGLSDTPSSYSGQALKGVRVNAGATALEFFTIAGSTDEAVKVSSNDTTAGFLNGKLVAGSGISFTENNDGANETLTIATSITQYTDELAQDAVGNVVGNGLDYDDPSGAISVDETELTHNLLGSKQGGSAGEYYHLTSAQNTLVGALDSDLATFSLPASTTISVFGASLVDDADASTARTTLGLVIGTNVQAFNQNLADIAALADPNADRLLFWDDSAGAYKLLTLGTNLSITGTTIDAAGGSGTGLSDGDYGDITVSGSATVMTIDNDVVTYAKMQNVSATSRILGRITAGAGDVEELTAANVKTILALTKSDVGLGSVDNVQQMPLSYLDTDITLAANSDVKVPSQKAIKSYVDSVASGLSPKQSVRLATAAVLPTVVYSNGSSGVGATLTAFATGVLTIDGVTVAVNDRVLIKDQAASLQNGIYKCTVAGAIGVLFVLTRATDNDTVAEIIGSFVFVEEGTANADSGFVNTNTAANLVTIGTDGITFTQFSGAGEITAGAALTKTGNTLDVAVDGSTIEVSSDALRVKDAGITLAKMADMATASLLGRNTAGTGVPEVLSAGTARTLLGLVIGTNVQAYDADLTTWAGLTPSANAQSLVTAADYAAMRALLDLEAGTDFYSISAADAAFQPKDADLTTIAGLTATTDNFIVSVASAWASRTPAQVRTTLGLVIGTNVQAFDSDLTTWAGITPASGVGTFLAAPSSANLLAMMTDKTGTGLQVFGTTPTLATPVINGLATGTGVASAATASTLAARDANANLLANNWLGGYTTTATAAGTTTLTVGSTYAQFFTGSTTQIVTLPVASTLSLGHQFYIVNNSSGAVTVNSSGGNAVKVMGASSTAIFTCILASGTGAASWSVAYVQNISNVENTAISTWAGSTNITTLGTISAGAIPESLLTFTDITTGNASTSNHGFLKKLSNVATQYMDGTGAWSTPAAALNSTAGVSTGPASSLTQTITHGLGRTPKIIRLYGMGSMVANASARTTPSSAGIWNDSGNRCVSIADGASGTQVSSTTYAIRLNDSGGPQTGVVGNVGATTFDIVWTNIGGAAVGVFLWEAQ